MDKIKRVNVYLRVSTQEQNTELQKTEITNYLELRGMKVTTFWEDKATGTNTSRPQFQQMLQAARARDFDVLVVWKLDRFARSLKDLVTHLSEFTELGIEFISIKDNIDMTTSAGRLMVHLLASFSEFEISLTKERCRAGIASAKRKGTRLGRPQITDSTKILELRNQGLSLSAIAKRLGVSKTAVHKSLSKNSFIKSVTNIETIQTEESFIKV